MSPDIVELLRTVSGREPRRYSTYDFGRLKDEQCVSVVVPQDKAEALLFSLRPLIPSGHVAFIGTTRWLGDEQHDNEVEVVAGKGDSQFDILRLARSDACNYGMGTEDLIERLKAWDMAYGIDIFQAETDTIQFKLKELPADMPSFANEVYEFCPDTADEAEDVEENIREHKQVFLWWD